MAGISGNIYSEPNALSGELPGRIVIGVPGKSAYQYALESGYTGTEEEFSIALAQSGNGGTVDEETVRQIVEEYLKENPPESGGNVENGEDGFSPIATVTQTDSGAVISITDKDGTTTATITNGKDGRDGADGQPGKDGADGAPGEKGDKGDKGDPGEPGQKGEKGDTGAPGADGAKGDKGDKGDTGPQGEPGKDGTNGKDGTSVTHSWNGTTLTVTSASGTSSADLKGAKGDKGDKGDSIKGDPGSDGVSPTVAVSKSGKVTTVSITDKNGTKTATINDGADGSPGSNGKDGTSVTVKSVSESTADGGSNVVTFSDGKTVTIKNGSKGSTGATGAAGRNGVDGYTPIVGVDYYTETDKAEFSEYIASELAKRGQLKPEFAQTIAECTDTTKLYVLPDGYIYAYMLTEVTKPDQPQYTNVLPTAIGSDNVVFNGTGYKNGYRLNSSATEKQQDGCGYTGFIKITPNQSNTIRMKNLELCSEGYHYVHGYNTSFVRQGQALQNASMLTMDANGVVTFDVYAAWDYIRISNGLMNTETIITVNEEIKVIPGGTTTEYRWTNTGHAFVPADYEDRVADLEKKVGDLTDEIESGLAVKPDLFYISPNGDDGNDGLTASTPKKTVMACVNAGAKRVSAKRGSYNEAINLQNIGSLEISPTDNEKTYVVEESRQPIIFDTSDVLNVSSVTAYNSIKRIAYSNAANVAYNKVFVEKTLAPTVSASQSSYHAAVWLFSDDEKTVCRKPKPVLTIAECEAEANTFCYSDGYIYINADMTSVTKIVVPTITATGFYVNGANNLVLREVEVRFSGEYSFDLRSCAWVDLYKCASKYTTRASGFHPVDTNGMFRACYATKCFDGFAPNGHGHTTYTDCVSEYNYDDGMSHHSGTEGTVIGGRYEGNGKGGNTPAYGAKVNIYGGLYKNNAQFGIGYVGSEEAGYVSGIVQGAVMVNNPIGLLVQANCEVMAMSCVYKNNTADKENHGLLTEY